LSNYSTSWQRIASGIIDELVLLPLWFTGSYFNTNTSNSNYIMWNIFITAIYSFYFIWLHGKYGQTLGKYFLDIKVTALNETSTIGLAASLKREGIWLVAQVIGIAILSFKLSQSIDGGSNEIKEDFDNYIATISLFWIILEITTMQFNTKRRAIHDFIAGSVVIKI